MKFINNQDKCEKHTYEEIQEVVHGLIRDILNVTPSEFPISPDMELVRYVGLDSLDIAYIELRTEKIFGEWVSPESDKKIKTVGDVIQYIYKAVKKREAKNGNLLKGKQGSQIKANDYTQKTLDMYQSQMQKKR